MARFEIALSLAALLSASAALAGPRVPDRPDDAEIAAAMPAEALAEGVQGVVMLACRADGRGGVSGCAVESETPAGYGLGAAALTLAPKVRGEPGAAGAAVRVPMLMRGRERLVVTAVSPPSQLRALYPAGAKGAGVGVARCQAGESGRFMGCSVAAEEPAGVGFGEAALAAATDFRFGPKDSAGRGVAGRMFVLPLRFEGR